MFTERTTRPWRPWRVLLEALAAPHGVDRYLEWLRPTWSLDETRATVSAVTRPTADAVTLALRPNRCWAGFRAGQHVALGVEIDGVRHTRCYSLAGSAHRPGELELTVKAHPGGRVSPWLREHARPGQVVHLGPAQGGFVLPEPRPARLLLISGGSGITPVLSMLRTLCDEGHPGVVTFLHYAERPEAMPYAAELDRLAARHRNVRVVRVFTRDPAAGDLRGRFGAGQLREADPEHASAETYLCGPERLMEPVRGVYRETGLAGRLHEESFAGLPTMAPCADGRGRVHCTRSGIEIDGDGRTLLELAESAGLEPAHGCRRGICHTCVRRLSAGRLRDVRTGAERDHADVDVRLCIHAPVGDVHIDL